jgi:hypothetical protein
VLKLGFWLTSVIIGVSGYFFCEKGNDLNLSINTSAFNGSLTGISWDIIATLTFQTYF